MGAVRVLCGDILPALDMHWIGEDEHRQAQNGLLAADRRKVSLVDCSSFHVMRNRMMRAAFAFDPRFREQGFEVLPTSVSGDDERARTADSE
jgi:hypothetical protein